MKKMISMTVTSTVKHASRFFSSTNVTKQPVALIVGAGLSVGIWLRQRGIPTDDF